MRERRWTIYLTQDKHLDYNWCGSPAEIELRMVALVDYFLEQAERRRGRWNLDCTLWLDVYRRHRGEEGERRLIEAIRSGSVGYGAAALVLLWGLLGTELSIHALAGGRRIEEASGRPSHTALLMESWGLQWGVASLLAECGVENVARGTYPLRAEEYHGRRSPLPLFLWEAANGRRLLVHWPPYTDTKSWGGYAEAFALAQMAGEEWDALHLRSFPDRNTPEVFGRRVDFIRCTVERYEALGADYPVSSIMLLGTGWDNWTLTDDYRLFVERFNAVSDGRILLVDARYDEFFDAVRREMQERSLELPVLRGSFGITWEEWGAHLAASTEALDLARALVPDGHDGAPAIFASGTPEEEVFRWRGGEVRLDPARFAVASIRDAAGAMVSPEGGGPRFGELVVTRFVDQSQTAAIFPEVQPFPASGQIEQVTVRRVAAGVEARMEGRCFGFGIAARYVFHDREPWIDVGYRLCDGWDEGARTAQICFPFALSDPTYRYDTAASILCPEDDLAGSNPELYALQSFALAEGGDRTVILLSPDAFLVQFGAGANRAPGYGGPGAPCQITSLPLMNLTRQDLQLGQGGRRAWSFRYRVVFARGARDPLLPFREAQRFATPPFVWVPGTAPTVPALEKLDFDFPGGPLVSARPGGEGGGLVLRFWNTLDRPVSGGLRLLPGFTRAERCDALERPLGSLPAREGRVHFEAGPRGLATVALRGPHAG